MTSTFGIIWVKYTRKDVISDDEMPVEARLWRYIGTLLEEVCYVLEENEKTLELIMFVWFFSFSFLLKFNSGFIHIKYKLCRTLGQNSHFLPSKK